MQKNMRSRRGVGGNGGISPPLKYLSGSNLGESDDEGDGNNKMAKKTEWEDKYSTETTVATG